MFHMKLFCTEVRILRATYTTLDAVPFMLDVEQNQAVAGFTGGGSMHQRSDLEGFKTYSTEN